MWHLILAASSHQESASFEVEWTHRSNLLKKHDRTSTYENIYSSRGYHADLRLTHAAELIDFISLHHAHDASRNTVRVLDLGCSHGLGVQLLWRAGFDASGMDIAPTAVVLARTHRRWERLRDRIHKHDPCRGEPCFKQGSGASMPWANRSFSVIMSTDMLEHLPTELVPLAVAEMTRVATEALFLVIAAGPDAKLGVQLHETRQTYPWWQRQREASGHWLCVPMPAFRSANWCRTKALKEAATNATFAHLWRGDKDSKANPCKRYLMDRAWRENSHYFMLECHRRDREALVS
jgi:2-polyprenyl-3-methyl-5-hydroxy-6-metoxy-1,4-benzoquinol methylase